MKSALRLLTFIVGLLLTSHGRAAGADSPRLATERILLRMNVGDVVIALYPDVAPKTVEQMLKLVRAGVYDGEDVARVEPDWVIQLACAHDRLTALSSEQQSAIHPLPGEFSKVKHLRGSVTMTHSDANPNDAETSFYFMLKDAPHLYEQHTVFGHVEHGMDVLDGLSHIEQAAGVKRPKAPVYIGKAQVVTEAELPGLQLREKFSPPPENAGLAAAAQQQAQPGAATQAPAITPGATPATATPAASQDTAMDWFFKTVGVVVLAGAALSVFAPKLLAKIFGRVRRMFGGTSAMTMLIPAFNLQNIAAVFRTNQPPWPMTRVEQLERANLSPEPAYRVDYAGWMLARYAHLAGLDNRWEMFSTQSRFNWWFEIQALTDGGPAVTLNLPRQGERTFPQRTFFDFREAKYHLNLYGGDELRERYGRYLCRENTTVEGRTVQAIRFIRHVQNLRTRAEAHALGSHLEPRIDSQALQTVPCSPERPSEPGGRHASAQAT